MTLIIDGGLHDGLIIPQSWSLHIELLFYLISPFIINTRFTKIFLFLFSLSLFSVLLYINKFNYLDYLFFSNLFFFILGIYSCKFTLCLNLEKKIKSNILIIRNINYLYFFIIFLILIMNYLNFEFESSDRVNSLIYIFFGFCL